MPPHTFYSVWLTIIATASSPQVGTHLFLRRGLPGMLRRPWLRLLQQADGADAGAHHIECPSAARVAGEDLLEQR